MSRAEFVSAYLASEHAPRVMTTGQLRQAVDVLRPGLGHRQFVELVQGLTESGSLIKATRGVYVNGLISPSAQLPEVAGFIRSGAVVSLHTVLGDVGFLNNPAAIVTATVPWEGRVFPKTGEVRTDLGVFRFQAMPAAVMPTDDELDPRFPYLRALPERALADWMHYARSKGSRMTWPPFDVDVEALDIGKTLQIAERLGVRGGSTGLEAYLLAAEKVGYGEDPGLRKDSPVPDQEQALPAASKPRP